MTMLEKVARAMWNVQRDDLDKCDMELEDVGNRYLTYDMARAALGALREPTQPILKAMAESVACDDEGEFPPVCDLIDFSGENKRRTVLVQMWRDAIDAALKENDGAR